MARARTRMTRVQQVARCLEDYFPVGRPVRIFWSRRKFTDVGGWELAGYCETDKKSYRIFLSFAGNPSINAAVDTLIHEWAHLLSGLNCSRHDGPWSEWHGRICGFLYDDAGLVLADEY